VLRLVLIGLVAGVFSALFGVGGGILIVPLLILVAAFRPREATAASLGAIGITALAGVTIYAFEGKVDVGHGLLVGIPALAGVALGVSFQQRLSGRTLGLAFAGLIAGIGVWFLAT
jgi:uncharacterized membrane protein YfcA